MQPSIETERIARRRILFIVLLLGVAVIFCLNIAMGSVNVPLPDVVRTLFGREIESSVHESIIMRIRLPRTLATLAGGACLAISGLMLQIFFGNPIVEPYVLGISSGSIMFVSIVMLGGVTFGFNILSPLFMFIGSLIGAFIVMLAVVFAAGKVKSIVTLLVIGIMIGFLAGSVRSILTAFADLETVGRLTLWTMGSFSGFTWQQVRILLAITGVFSLAAILMSKPLNALLLGEKYAVSMGVGIRFFRIAIIVIASVLTAALTAFAGPISFVGLAVPHMMRMGFKTADNRILLPASILGGALMMSLCDLIARTVLAPRELAIGAITALVGAPLLIFMLVRRKNVL
ncbi:MAG: iron ABC transporter permease [Oscillospiraceae bacterium]|nr:iron ABC transporter permease [Oscillospiraceae bacterium]